MQPHRIAGRLPATPPEPGRRRRRRNLTTWLSIGLFGWLVAAGCGTLGVSQESLDRTLAAAQSAEARGQTAQAIDHLHDITRHRPASIKTREALVQLCLEQDTIDSRTLAATVLRQLVRLAPDDPDYRHDLGTLLFRQGFNHASENELERLLTRNPDHPGAHLALCDLYRGRWYQSCEAANLTRMRDHAQRARDLSPEDPLVSRRHLATLLLTGELEDALANACRDVQHWPRDPELRAIYATTLAALGHWQAAADAYEATFDLMSGVQRNPFVDVSPLANPYEAGRLRDLPPDDRLDYLRAFWKRRDPTPTTPLNERLIEHYRRVVVANISYDHPLYARRGSETAKGELLIRYGEPYWDEWYMFPATTHSYWIDGELQPVRFVNLAGEFYVPFSSTPNLVDFASYLAPQSYAHQFAEEWLDYTMQLASFRGPDGLTRQEIYLATPVSAALSAGGALELEVVAFDPSWQEMARREETLPQSAAMRAGHEGRALVHQFALQLPPGPYQIATQIRTSDGRLFGTTRREGVVRDLSPRQLSMSDLELAFRIGGTGQAHFRKGDLTVVPNAGGAFVATEPLAVYFDIYDLPLDHETGHYLLSYRIRPAPRHGSSIFGRLLDAMRLRTFIEARSVEQSSTPTVSRYLNIDIGQLPADRYELTIAVTDLTSGARVERTASFEYLAAPPADVEPRHEATRPAAPDHTPAQVRGGQSSAAGHRPLWDNAPHEAAAEPTDGDQRAAHRSSPRPHPGALRCHPLRHHCRPRHHLG